MQNVFNIFSFNLEKFFRSINPFFGICKSIIKINSMRCFVKYRNFMFTQFIYKLLTKCIGKFLREKFLIMKKNIDAAAADIAIKIQDVYKRQL